MPSASGHSLTPREAPYNPQRRCWPPSTPATTLIEVVQSRFADPVAQDKLTMLGDFVAHGCFILGASIPGWRDIDFAAQPVELLFGERSVASRSGNPRRRHDPPDPVPGR